MTGPRTPFDRDTALSRANDPVIVGDRSCSREEAIDVLSRKLESVRPLSSDTQRLPLGVL